MKNIQLLALSIWLTFTSAVAFAGQELCSAIENTIGVNPPTTVDSIGTPLSRTEKDVQNEFDDSLDKSILLKYPNGYVDFYYVTHLNKFIFYGAQLQRESFNPTINAAIPDTIDSLQQMHGYPNNQTSDALLYYCDISETSYVEIFHQDKEITSFKYTQEML
ncbi:hypothetical protein [Thiorhodovibrio frisius]|uniref:Beta-lactamase-inhibitor-like PepSY-like domain-containing protein n=1 Tax=Thiorhodovibrio frisius TaxID=631362 RepID=H8YYX2_9GAMM|nr:hypothetical protein [Thiorhodovibrio frisius]EIC23648.1 hypothetical protein Thi970DRAFT_01329 [Thiorhodovibrio frisius]WPL23261.1 hypothetical protein Thiofri_03446 [Thiorhodovibrio frisius]